MKSRTGKWMLSILFVVIFLFVACSSDSGKVSSDSSDKIWVDSKTGLIWQVQPTGGRMEWTRANMHCEDLNLAGYSDWRLPTISELRSLIRGCPTNEISGDCRVKEGFLLGCLSIKCSDPCRSCTDYKGPGAKGAYMPTELKLGGDWMGLNYWSSSPGKDFDNVWWTVWFAIGNVVQSDPEHIDEYTRCVRH